MISTFDDLTLARQSLLQKMSEVPRTIVYVDNDVESINSFRDFFTLQQFNIKTFVDPIEAFLWIKTNTVDLVISEIDLPILSGISLLRKLRLHDKTSKIPYILVTRNMVKYIPDAKNAKANDLYPKPLDFDKLLKRIKYLSKIQIDDDVNMKLLQKTWSRRIYPGHIKRFFGLTIGLLLLTLSLPFMLLIGLILKMQNNKESIFKIEEKIGGGYDIVSLYHFNTTQSKFSKFLTKTNIYRWPEIFNMIIGDISLIGNKPLPLEEAPRYTSDRNSLRFLSPTGLTGIRHLYDIKLKKSIVVATELENDYAMNRNFFKDLKIFLQSLLHLFQTSNNQYFDL